MHEVKTWSARRAPAVVVLAALAVVALRMALGAIAAMVDRRRGRPDDRGGMGDAEHEEQIPQQRGAADRRAAPARAAAGPGRRGTARMREQKREPGRL